MVVGDGVAVGSHRAERAVDHPLGVKHRDCLSTTSPFNLNTMLSTSTTLGLLERDGK